jgi:legumain
MKHMRAFANICNSGVSQAVVEEACRDACNGHDQGGHLHPTNRGYSA